MKKTDKMFRHCKIRQSLMFSVFVLALFLTTPTDIFAQSLPAKISSYLNNNYKGWKLSSETDGCGAEFSKSKVSGDFNGDKKTDYAVKFLRGRKGYIIAFVSNRANYKPIILESGTTRDIKNQGLSIARKGETYGEIINDNFDRVTRRLQNDAPVGGTCESSAYIYVYKNGVFRRAFTSD
jgi:hypothetical protein